MRVPMHRVRFDLPSAGQARDALLNLLFPSRCVVCDQWGANLCDSCLAKFPRVAVDRGPHGWTALSVGIPTPTPSIGLYSDRPSQPFAFRSRRSAFIYAEGVRDTILALKYGGITAVVGPLIAAVDVSAIPDDVDCLVAVPMHGRRRRVRGFNQADLIAQRLAARLGLPVETNALRRTRATAPQARLPLGARGSNVAGAFVAHPQHASGRRILLVDDVPTTGATFDSCARALLDAGAESVDAWAVAQKD